MASEFLEMKPRNMRSPKRDLELPQVMRENGKPSPRLSQTAHARKRQLYSRSSTRFCSNKNISTDRAARKTVDESRVALQFEQKMIRLRNKSLARVQAMNRRKALDHRHYGAGRVLSGRVSSSARLRGAWPSSAGGIGRSGASIKSNCRHSKPNNPARWIPGKSSKLIPNCGLGGKPDGMLSSRRTKFC